MPSVSETLIGKTYWRSLDELADTPEFRRFVETEFPALAPDFLASPSRRRFLKLMGASLAMAGLTGCRWPKEAIAPYGSRPDGRTPGEPVQYATAMELGASANGLLVTSYDGRPIKVEGNPDHPFSRGATSAFAQASVLELYDPDRSKSVMELKGRKSFHRTWDEFAAFARLHFEGLRTRRGEGLCVLSEAFSSPGIADVRLRFLKTFPLAKWHEYEPVSWDNEREGARLAFGEVHRTHYALDRADVIVSLDADLLMTHPAALKYARDWAVGREVDEQGRRGDNGQPMNRLHVVESALTVTGSVADHRLAVPSQTIARVAVQLAAELRKRGVEVQDISAQESTGPLPEAGAAFIQAVARDLVASRGHGVIAVGPRQPAEVHALAHVLNAALGNVGQVVSYTEDIDPERSAHVEAIRVLAGDIDAGEVNTLIILGGNPVFDAPADLELGRRLDSVSTTIHLSLYPNETWQRCTWRVPRAHYLESWDSARAYDGTISVVQPLIEPLYGGKTPSELLALASGEKLTTGHEIVRRTLSGMSGAADFELWWRRALHDGLIKGTAWSAVDPKPQIGPWSSRLAELARANGINGDSYEVVLTPDSHVYDGRFANNGWLQEMPDPLTKLTWDNAALVSPADAERLAVRHGDVVRIERNGRTLELPVAVLPGHADGSVTVSFGYGRTSAGRVGDGTGFDAYQLRTCDAMHVLPNASLTPTGRKAMLAVTQDHWAIQSEVGQRQQNERVARLLIEAKVEEYKQHPDFARHAVHHPPLTQLWQGHEYSEGHRWGMSINLNRCIGCSACVVACQAENNIPVVGKEEVDKGREMHWIRIDRYFSGEPSKPQVAHQPVACHHCENAPCEQVCPVAATVHSSEGLNDMVYNRCIGTRYCANNCPYKVRRFNWFNNHQDLSETEKMIFNPEVTVRSRGVMEKCTYCVQRINAVKITAKNERRPVNDGEIVPACAQVCPTRAIVFGDLNDPHSQVAKLKAHGRSYGMLAELNVRPRTEYLAKLRNPAGEHSAGGGPEGHV